MKNSEKIAQYFDAQPDGTIIAANEMYEKAFSKMTQDAFFRMLERLAADGVIIRVAKGLYAKGSDKDKNVTDMLLNYLFGEENSEGMYIGYNLYNKYGISSVKKSTIELYSNVIKGKSFNVGNIKAKKPGVELNFENARIIEALEILQNYSDIEELNKVKFARYARNFARGYNDEAAINCIENMRYKKSTIAFMKKILEMYKAKNTLSQYLSYATDYKVPPVQRVAR